MCSYSPTESDNWKKFVVYTPPRSISQSPDLVDSEKRSLYYFRSHAAKAITAPFYSELWVDCMFSLSENHVFVRSALIAFSTLHESFTQPTKSRTRLQNIAERHYTKALSAVSSANNLSIDAVLAACLVFYSLESLRDAPGRALQHARAGINIIRDRPPASTSSPRATTLTEAIFRNFLALQNQVQEMSDPDAPRAYDTMRDFDPLVHNHFHSIEEAQHHVEIIHNEIKCLLSHCENLLNQGFDLAALYPTEVLPRYEKVMARFEQWREGVKGLEISLQPCPTLPSYPGYLILKIYEEMGQAMLSSFGSKQAWITYDPGFARALDLIEEFLEHQTSHILDGGRAFTISLGVIPLLFTLCFRSNNAALRDRSFDLLRRSKRREGLWDSETAVRLAEPVIAMKNRLAANEVSQCSMDAEVSFISENAIQLKMAYEMLHTARSTSDSPGSGARVEGERRCNEIIIIRAE